MAYINIVLAISAKLEETAALYGRLGQDKAVAAALAAISDENRTFTLGPGNLFENARRAVAKEAKEIQSGAIKVRKESNTFWVHVRMNDKTSREMVVDTGASALSLPHDAALELGLEIKPGDELIRVQLADGRLIEAAKKTLDTVQVGQFIVKDVECIVLPAHLAAAPPLLGNTFFRHFQFKLDPDAEELNLVRLSPEKEQAAPRSVGAASE